MNNNSFYGGRDGRPMIITKKYSTVQEMLKDFSGLEEIKPFEEESNPGTGNRPYATELGVAFGDYVIIETENRNNPENGRIFRRGLDFNNIKNDDAISGWILNEDTNIYEEKDFPSYGAKLVSQIVGPAGDAPHFQPVPFVDEEGITQTLDSIKQKYEAYDVMSGEGIFNVAIGNLVPGKDKAGNFIDDITWKHCSVRDTNAETSTAYIGFTFPYTVIEFEAVSVNPYYNRTDKDEAIENQRVGFGHDPLVEGRTDTLDHPFYEKWKISIPRGIRGMSIENIGIAKSAEEIAEVYIFDFDDKDAEYSRVEETGLLKIKEYDNRQDDIDGNRWIMYCTVVDYDRIPNGDKYKIYLGDYNMIIKDEVIFDDDGSLSINYTHEDKDEWPQKINWITDISLDKENGKFILTTNNDNIENINTDLTWVKNLTIDETGKLNTITTTGNNQIKNQQLHWIKDISINDESGKVTYTEVDGATTTTDQLTWVRDVVFNENNGTVTVRYTTNQKDTVHENLIDWIKSIKIAQNGEVTVESNNGSALLAEDQEQLKWATNIKVNDDGTIATEYNHGDSVIQGPTMDWITSATLDDITKELSINYVNATDINVNLKTPNLIELDTGKFYATYNTGERVEIGTLGTATLDSGAGGEEPDPNLSTGGVWFVIQEM